ncbi:MAG: hypothetical protein HMLIMOIP_001706 [Candidatus Nitrosomirales archaeon]|jgi:hypothetical protein
MRNKLLALVTGIVLLGTFVMPAYGVYVAQPPKTKATQLTLDMLPECTNLFQCNATFHAGDTVTFTGILTDREGKFIPDATVNIYRFEATEIPLLASATTDVDGTFKTTWEAQFIEKKTVGETFKQQLTQVVTLFAKFEGDETYTASQSGKMIITVKIIDMITIAATDKKLYRQGDTALIFVNFVEADFDGRHVDYGAFIDPDDMRVTYDGSQVVELSKKKTGSYTFLTPPLTVGHHQLVINPTKDGYNNRVGFVTVQVSGFFGK